MYVALGSFTRSVRAGEVVGSVSVPSCLRNGWAGKPPFRPRRREPDLPDDVDLFHHTPSAHRELYPPNHEPRLRRNDTPDPDDRVVSARRVQAARRIGAGQRRPPAPARPRDAPIGRRDALKGTARGLAAWTLLPSVIAAPIALADPVELAPTAELAPFVGKAGFFIRYPNAWVRATDRPGTDNGKAETLALVGNFKDIDTVSVRREPMDLHRDFADAAANEGNEGEDEATRASRVAVALTASERDAVAANQNFGVVGGVENGRSGVMDFKLGAC